MLICPKKGVQETSYIKEGIERTYISSTPSPFISTSWPPYIQSLGEVSQ